MTNRSVLLKADGLLLNHYINRLPLTLEELERIAHDMDWLLDTYQEATDFISRAGIADFVKEHKAFATIYDGQAVILYDGQLPYHIRRSCSTYVTKWGISFYSTLPKTE